MPSPDSRDIFLIGSARSGGTLLQNILCSDPSSVQALVENHWVAMVASVYMRSLQRVKHEQAHYFADEEDLRSFHSEWIRSFLKKVRVRHAPATTLILKSIVLGAHYRELHDLLPEAQFIVSVRDPRDIVVSMIDVGERQEAGGAQNSYPRNMQKLCEQIIPQYYQAYTLTQNSLDNQVLWVKYEDLVTSPKIVIERIEKWAGLDLSGYDPAGSWPKSLVDVDQIRKDSVPFVTESWGRRISENSIGRYREKLSASELKAIEQICGPLMKRFGYTE